MTCYCISTPAATEVLRRLLAKPYDCAYYVLELSLKTRRRDLKIFEESAQDRPTQVG